MEFFPRGSCGRQCCITNLRSRGCWLLHRRILLSFITIAENRDFVKFCNESRGLSGLFERNVMKILNILLLLEISVDLVKALRSIDLNFQLSRTVGIFRSSTHCWINSATISSIVFPSATHNILKSLCKVLGIRVRKYCFSSDIKNSGFVD